MGKINKAEEELIENYYKKKDSGEFIWDSTADNDGNNFSRKLDSAMDKMDILNYDMYDFDVNILRIISEGEKIRNVKKERKEFLGFVGVASSILSTIVLLTIMVNQNIFMYYQIIAFSLLPLSLIPLAKFSYGKED